MEKRNIIEQLTEEAKKLGRKPSEAFEYAAGMFTDSVTKGEATIAAGMFIWSHESGEKNCSGTIRPILEDLICHEYKRLVYVENVVNTTDENLLLFDYGNALPEGCCGGGSRNCDGGDGRTGGWFDIVTAFVSPSYCVLIDAQGYPYCRYVHVLPNWREMFAADLEKIEEEKKREEEEEVNEALQEQAAAALAYSKDCAAIRPYMAVENVNELPRNKQTAAAGKNIKSVLKHFFPGVKFSVRHEGGWGAHFVASWQDGPTVDEVENCCNWGIFGGWVYSFDGMTDSDESHRATFTDFAQKYGLMHLDGVEFDRGCSQAVRDEIRDYVLSKWRDMQLDEAGDYHQGQGDYCKILGAFSGYLDQYGANFWLNVDCVTRLVSEKISYFTR